ncbi:MAG TPA: DUF4352 domain-containing protein [Hungateiclostridium thermocellum]|jgi:hypothetical protein|uniref:DUF4352 domain-containing protein n=2 Tax=Acetivibrio thermocellus TaxID=1515 RepID=A3DD69_ACET2|nr:DUF4352 domain-containing protein [Acetivibrio thermocellus]CDG35357.1 hypothetical protein CTHBC1_0694 [Acetivibrio thermocellus BC1]ABN51898.1 hypothetical protein Cthe_0663 [Acetivibrio thermocellus ATCC 27405]ADU74623.1 hypothetical protein Clo1313_1561 [Acetivibrio thermocellus DSM 1313]ALX08566.1 protein of unknown function DUF1942 [Acetivibrio thermocellus AD2]ANV76315.1 protein of unknown function DUF1942 [Acetivibrio thermocellus DSM 2360]
MKKFAALLIFTVVFLLVGCGGFVPQNAGKDTALPTGTGVNKPDTAAKTAEPMTPAVSEESRIKSYNLGDIVELNNIIFIVNGTREVPENRFLSPENGNIWYAIDVSIENKSNETFNFSSMLMFTLIDGEKLTYDTALVPDLKGNVDGEITPGNSVRGEVAFEIPEDAKDLMLEIDPILYGEKVVVKLDR